MGLITVANFLDVPLQNVTQYHDHKNAVDFRTKLEKVRLNFLLKCNFILKVCFIKKKHRRNKKKIMKSGGD